MPIHLLDLIHEVLEVMFVERNDHEQHLDVHLDDRFTDQGGAEERPEWNQEVAARETGEVEQRVRDLQSERIVSGVISDS